MSKYTLSINIHAESKELLESLMVTLESISEDINKLNTIELCAISGPDSISFATKPRKKTNDVSVMQRNMILDRWMFL